MPNVLQPPAKVQQRVEFAASVSLDLINALYFTFLAGEFDGVPAWPAATLAQMDPSLRDEMNALFTYPRGEPGVMGALNDALFLHRETWADVDALLRFVRDLPPGDESAPGRTGIQGLSLYALRWPCVDPADWDGRGSPREALARAIESAGFDAPAALNVYDHPEDVRARVLRLIRRFYDEHYRPDEERRRESMERSAAAHRGVPAPGIDTLLRSLTGRDISCIQDEPAAYTNFIFVPSVDVGPYTSCADMPPVHALYYACEPRFEGGHDEGDEPTQRLALVYKALADEQRLRILRELRSGELYAQEIVERTGLHQSVVSRHLSFMKAVGLVNSRRQNNMKFFSLNRDMHGVLSGALDALLVGA